MSDKVEITTKNNNNTYDEVPYESYPYIQSHPYHMMTLGILFGMQPTAPEKARVLELGCAAGGNIIPHAINYPKAQFVGVDLSKTQIEEADKHVQDLGLKNIKFHHCSITDIDDSFGKFDYIICHGVISWVPEFVRSKIFEIAQKNLSENGIAYISYNTLPGWNMIRTIRDMMLYHSATFSNVQDKISQSRLLLDFVKDSLEGSTSPYSEMLRNEANLLAKQSNHYLRHDHLEEENKQYYFNEFMAEANKHNLQYLSDSTLSTMYLGNMPPKVAEALKAVNDIVRTEQYMDFITNRRFRATLLCNSSIKLNRTINSDDITKFNLALTIIPEKELAQVDLNDSLDSLKFFLNGNKESSLSTSSPYMKAILYSFAEHLNNPISFDKLSASSNQKLGGNKLAEIKKEFLSNAMRLVLQGYITITLQNTRSKANLDCPKVAKLPVYQVTHTNNLWVTSLKHEAVEINIFEKYAIKYMDGKRTKQEIVDAVMPHVTAGELVLSREGKKIEDHEELVKELTNCLNVALNKAAANALLI
ncbi:Methyltransferase domain protein [Candidatus Trichorickettsia mobilis]|uniref:Methyltransferase domain protein n=1 Tax=Candidatus Trichorickettsia mobilis TaxID=1346319 RepID=A0ABZ0UVZ2_9RICK|nr:class I SAM-dependent methyltransferase [Candidatus Trichorickettsia mobilis]WPY00209.1 Methyltransferase domain protein [Candidatus Trichorickettsia mobilis]